MVICEVILRYAIVSNSTSAKFNTTEPLSYLVLFNYFVNPIPNASTFVVINESFLLYCIHSS